MEARSGDGVKTESVEEGIGMLDGQGTPVCPWTTPRRALVYLCHVVILVGRLGSRGSGLAQSCHLVARLAWGSWPK